MTIATSSTKEFSVGRLVELGHRVAGLLNPQSNLRQADMTFGCELLELITKGLTTRGIQVRKVDFLNVLLISGTNAYNLDPSVADVVGTAMYIEPGQVVALANSETPLRQVSRDEWQGFSSKNASARPTTYYVHRVSSIIQVRLWPVPGLTEAGGTVRFQGNFWRANSTDANATVDAERYWEDYLVSELAARLAGANSLPVDRCAFLKAEAREKLELAQSYSMDRPDVQLFVDHGPSWRGRRR